MERIAIEHRKGRRLLVMTTNLDTQKAVVWNLGAIASSGRPNRLSLFQDVLIASASIPGVFPAVKINAYSGARHIEELHSDGGSSSQLFTLPEQVMASSDSPMGEKKLRIHVIVNNALIPEFNVTSNSTFAVAGRVYAVLVKSQTKQGLLALYNFALRSGIAFRYAAINRAVPYSVLDPFNTDYMMAVYRLGYQGTISGAIWNNRPSFQGVATIQSPRGSQVPPGH
jgi:hypothetical protein